MSRFGAKAALASLLALVAIAVAAGGAFGYWDGTGSGAATAQLGSAETLSFAPGSPTANLYPGGRSDVVTVASNPNPYSVRIGALILDPGPGAPFAVDPGHGGCDVGALTFVTQDNDGDGWQVPPRVGSTEGTLTIDLPDAIRMSTAAADACQGATFQVALEGQP